MLKLRKYLKPFIASILAIIVLLFAQAMCELAMPDYMSNIVNVGILSGGIEDGVLEALRESEYDKLKIFMDEKQQKVFTDNYELKTSSNADKDMKENFAALTALKASATTVLGGQMAKDAGNAIKSGAGAVGNLGARVRTWCI